MKILAIETSCDDTGIAILEIDEKQNFKVLANLVASQIEVHKKYGGVYPMMAKREHQRNLVPVLIRALKEAKLISKSKFLISNQISSSKLKILKSILEREPDLEKKLIPFLKKHAKPTFDAIAVTNGPGLEPCLWVGVNFARALSFVWDVPIIPVNHIEGHILVNLLQNKTIQTPALALVVSGGHTQLVLMEKANKYQILGETRDDAAGECFDKCAKIMGLGYPGGPIISNLASKYKPEILNPKSEKNFKFQISNFKLPRPMLASGDYDFSFSGLKTAVLYAWKKIKDPSLKLDDRMNLTTAKIQMAAEVQQAIIDVLLKKTMKAAKDYGAKTIILGGGVTANKELRKQFENALATNGSTAVEPLKLLFPPANLSTDNGLMIAIAGYFKAKKSKFIKWQDLEADANLRVE